MLRDSLNCLFVKQFRLIGQIFQPLGQRWFDTNCRVIFGIPLFYIKTFWLAAFKKCPKGENGKYRTWTQRDIYYESCLQSPQKVWGCGNFPLQHFLRLNVKRKDSRKVPRWSGIAFSSANNERTGSWKVQKWRRMRRCDATPLGILKVEEVMQPHFHRSFSHRFEFQRRRRDSGEKGERTLSKKIPVCPAIVRNGTYLSLFSKVNNHMHSISIRLAFNGASLRALTCISRTPDVKLPRDPAWLNSFRHFHSEVWRALHVVKTRGRQTFERCISWLSYPFHMHRAATTYFTFTLPTSFYNAPNKIASQSQQQFCCCHPLSRFSYSDLITLFELRKSVGICLMPVRIRPRIQISFGVCSPAQLTWPKRVRYLL